MNSILPKQALVLALPLWKPGTPCPICLHPTATRFPQDNRCIAQASLHCRIGFETKLLSVQYSTVQYRQQSTMLFYLIISGAFRQTPGTVGPLTISCPHCPGRGMTDVRITICINLIRSVWCFCSFKYSTISPKCQSFECLSFSLHCYYRSFTSFNIHRPFTLL